MSSDGTDRHKYEVGAVFEAPHKGRWRVTNRMVDIDTDETLYRLCELDTRTNETEILTESQISRIYGENGRSLRPEGDQSE